MRWNGFIVLTISLPRYHGVMASDFIDGRSARRSSTAEHEMAEGLNAMFRPFTIDLDSKITIGRVYEQIHVEMFAICNIGDSLFADTELPTPDRTDFISLGYYTSMGFSVPVALGAHLTRPDDCAGDLWRRSVPDYGNGTVNNRACRFCSGHPGSQQRRLRHRTIPSLR